MRMAVVVTKSEGGPYDDESFNAGYSLGMLNAFLLDDGFTQPFFAVVLTDSIPQLDLIAMEAGWTITNKENLTPEGKWSAVRLVRDRGTFALN
jgi:hypothetical protein